MFICYATCVNEVELVQMRGGTWQPSFDGQELNMEWAKICNTARYDVL